MYDQAEYYSDPRFTSALTSLLHAGDHANSAIDQAWKICARVREAMDLDDVVLYVLGEDESALVQLAASGPKNPTAQIIVNPIQIPVGRGIVGTVACTGYPEIVEDTSTDDRYILDDDYRLSEISVPLIQSGRLIGVLDSENASRGFYTSDHLARMQVMASVASNQIARCLTETRLESANKRMAQLEQLAAQQLEISEQLRSAEEWLSRIDIDVAHNLQHELRNPLNTIMGISDVLSGISTESSHGNKSLNQFADSLRRSGQDLLDRITDLLELPGLSETYPVTAIHDVDVSRLLRGIGAHLNQRIREQGLRFELDTPRSVRTLRCDPMVLAKVVHSLIDNAVKFSSQGVVLVRLLANESGQPASIQVADQGIGIEPIAISRIFEPFNQVDKGMTRRYGGLGLGLTNAQRLCDLANYRMTVASCPGQGSVFEVHFNSPVDE